MHVAISRVLVAIHEANSKDMGPIWNSISNLAILKNLKVEGNPKKSHSIKSVFLHLLVIDWLEVNTDGLAKACRC